MQIKIGNTSSNEFESPKLELEKVIEELKNALLILCNTLA